MSEERLKRASMGAWIGIVGNLVLAAVKAVAGFMSGSKALLADAAHSASDVVGSLAVLIGIKAAQKPPDKDHPNGHGKAEPIAAIIVSMLLILIGAEVGIAAVRSLYSGDLEAPAGYAIYIILFSIAAKELMFQYKYRLGKQLSSQALIANAWEHRSDVYSSIAALIGIGGAMLGDVLQHEELYYLDPIAGLIIAIMVVRIGYRMIMESIHNTMDHVLHAEDADELIKAVQRVPGVIMVDDLRAREHGHYVVVDVKISVNPRISVLEGHDIAKMVKNRLMSRFTHVSDVFIHVNPYDPGYPYKHNVDPEPEDTPTILH